MKNLLATVMIVCLFAGVSVGDVWQDLAKYKYGEGQAADEAEKVLQQTPVAQHAAIEDSLIAVVASKDATQDGKALACRMLQQIGTEKCIPSVAGLLTDDVLSHYARLVLERMANTNADEAMRAALDSAPDKVKIGIAGSLGVRRNDKAVSKLAKLVEHGDPAVAAAAIRALGRIGGGAAAQRLRTLKPVESLVPVHMCALVACAESLTGADVASLYEVVLAGKTSQRIGALSGMLAVDDKKAVALMVGLLKGDDVQMNSGVLTLVAGEKSERLIIAMTDLLGTLPDEKKAALITALGARGDNAAVVSIAAYVTSTNVLVRDSAVMALKKSLKSGNKEMNDKALRLLAAWRRENAADELLVLVGSAPEEVDRILALRGYIRLAGEGPNLNEEQRAEMFKKAAELAKRVDEKKLIAGNLNKAPNVVALVIANTYLDDPAVREEAEQAAVDIAEHLQSEKNGSADVIKEVANKLLTSKNGGFVDRMKRLLAGMGKNERTR